MKRQIHSAFENTQKIDEIKSNENKQKIEEKCEKKTNRAFRKSRNRQHRSRNHKKKHSLILYI